MSLVVGMYNMIVQSAFPAANPIGRVKEVVVVSTLISRQNMPYRTVKRPMDTNYCTSASVLCGVRELEGRDIRGVKS